MPIDPVVSAVVSSIISSVAEGVLTAPPAEPSIGVIRTLPEETQKGTMASYGFGQAVIDGKLYPLSPGVQIRNELNMLVMPSLALSGPVKVRYQVDFGGYVYRIWMLSSAEASLPENR